MQRATPVLEKRAKCARVLSEDDYVCGSCGYCQYCCHAVPKTNPAATPPQTKKYRVRQKDPKKSGDLTNSRQLLPALIRQEPSSNTPDSVW